jgi:Protein of unknown function (DUF3800)
MQAWDDALETLFDISNSRWILSLIFYGDDSGTNEGSVVCVVAGYLGDRENWLRFSSDWQVTLDTDPKLPYFKMRECHHLDGAFTGWTRDAANLKLDQFVGLVNHYNPGLAEFGSVMPRDVFKRHVDSSRDPLFRDPYFFCLFAVTVGASRFVHTLDAVGERKGISFVLDEQGEKERDAAKQFYLCKGILPAEWESCLEMISFGDDKRFKPLQAADLIAWQVRRQFADVKEDDGIARPELKTLRERLFGGNIFVWSDSEMQKFGKSLQ